MKKGLAIIMAMLFSLSAFSVNGEESPKNIAAGKAYTVETDMPDTRSYNKDVDTGYMLTDGKKSSTTTISDANWVKLYRAVGRTITIDLEDDFAVTGFNCGFLQFKGPGVYCPKYFVISVSENGKDFMEVAALENPVPIDKPAASRAVYEKTFESTYKARYVRFHFNVEVNCFPDEFEVYGTALKGDEKPFVKTPEKVFPNSYAPKDVAGGAMDLMLLHTGYYPENAAIVDNTMESLIPYLAYVSTSGRILDTMFGSYIFTYVGGRGPSEIPNRKEDEPIIGVGPDTTRSLKSDWEFLLGKLFDPVFNLKALDDASEKVKTSLKLGDDYSVPVYITLPYPKTSDYVFGDYDGDGVDDKITSLADCVKAQKWFIEETLNCWDEAGYKNLELYGFYWMHEAISYGTFEDEAELIKLTIDLCHSYDKQIISIPFYQASGIEFYNELGFDCSFMQPNLSFNEPLQRDPAGMMEDFAEACKKYGLAVEMEIHHHLNTKGREVGKFYEQYMISCSRNGMMTDTPHAYYQGAGPGMIYTTAKSSDPYMRYIYDTTYKFIKNTLSFPDELKASVDNLTYVEKNDDVIGKITLNGDWYPRDVTAVITKEPKHGSVRVFEATKNFLYTPGKEYLGEDSFEVKLSLGDDNYDFLTINISVVEPGMIPSEPESKPETSDVTSADEDGDNKSLLIPILLGAVAVAAATAAAFGIIKRVKSKS